MAENATPAPQGRQIIIIATVVTVVFFTIFIVALRSCSKPTEQGAEKVSLPSHVVIYSNMDLKDAALVITRLKELKIPYQIKDEGRSIAVPRARADEARLGLAEKGLPAGGTVGWEIFDQSKLGATDFDKRIQFIRAISGELSRTISRISAVDDARVQIVIPETQLFEVTKAPVTASVLLKLKPGESLTPKQVNGIMYLVASSVENLKHDNITIIDINGNMLSGTEKAPVVQKEEAATPQIETKEEVVVEKGEEKAALGVQAKLDLENTLTSKVQSLLNKIFPPNVTIARVNVDSIINRKITVIILVDKTFKMNKAVKKATFETVSASVGYDKGRGDKIIMKSVPFRSTGPAQATSVTGKEQPSFFTISNLKALYRKNGRASAIVIVALLFLFLLSIFRSFGGRRKERAEESAAVEETEAAEEEVPVISQMKELASKSPELVAELIKTWVKQEGA